MSERMSVENKISAFAWIKKHGSNSMKTIEAIESELDRARAEEERLGKRVAELESELAIKTNECKLIHERGMEAIREANRGGDDHLRRIVREEIREMRVESLVPSGRDGLYMDMLISKPFANATWPDEEKTDG